MSLQVYHDNAFVGHVYIFHVAAVLLQIRTYLAQRILYFLLNDCFLFVSNYFYFMGSEILGVNGA